MAIATSPQKTGGYKTLAIAMMQDGQAEQAAALLRKRFSWGPSTPRLRELLGEAEALSWNNFMGVTVSEQKPGLSLLKRKAALALRKWCGLSRQTWGTHSILKTAGCS